MKIICNGTERDVPAGIMVIDLIKELDLNPETVVVECDAKILCREDYDHHPLKEGATLELIRFVGGG